VNEVTTQGFDLREFLDGLVEHLRNFLVAKSTGSTELIDATDAIRQRYASASEAFSVADLLRLQRFAGATQAALRWSPHPRFRLEADMVQMVGLSGAREVEKLVEELDELKKKLPEGRTESSGSRRPTTHAERAEQKPVAESQPMPDNDRTFRSIPEEEVRSCWPEFLKEVKEKRIGLSMTLENAKLLRVKGNTIHLGLADEFGLSSVKRYKRDIQEILGGVLKTPVRIEAERDTEGTPVKHEEKSNATGPATEEHPVVKALIRELGAEPL
jgi:DNA polymerase III gamma/tau subunit